MKTLWIIFISIGFFLVNPVEGAPVNKFVGIQYSIWFNHIHQNGMSPVFYPSSVHRTGFRYWGEPLRGVYLSDDVSIINQHADEIVNSGIDFIYLDYSNTDDSHHKNAISAILNVYKQRVVNGIPTPKVSFLMKSDFLKETYDLYFSGGFYDFNIFFKYGNKPLVLLTEDCVEKCQDFNAVKDFFTYKNTVGLKNSSTAWSHLELSPQSYYTNNSWAEAMPASPAQQADFMNTSTSRGRRYDLSTKINNGLEGQNYKDQWARVYDISPTFVLIKSYNEWTAQKVCLYNPIKSSEFYKYKDWLIDENCEACKNKTGEELVACEGKYLSCLAKYNTNLRKDLDRSLAECNRGESDPLSSNYRFTDEYNREYSTDIEPMREGYCSVADVNCVSHGKLYLDLTKNYIAKFKSTAANFVIRDSQTGQWFIKYGRKGSAFSKDNYSTNLTWASGNHYQPVIGDFNNDTKTDIGLRDTATGKWYFSFSDGFGSYTNTRNFNWAPGVHYQPIVGDFNKDGKTDIGLRNVLTGVWHFAFFDGIGHYFNTRNFNWSAGEHYQPIVGNFNGDGFVDIGLRDSSTGRFYFANSDGANNYHNTRNFSWSSGVNYQGFVGDFNCDGKSDIGLRDSLDGSIYLANYDGGTVYHNEHNYKWLPGERYQILASDDGCY